MLFVAPVTAEERSSSVFGEGFDITIDNAKVLFWPQNTGLKKDGGPYFITIEIAGSEEELNDPATCRAITQGIPLEIETPYPIGLTVRKGKTEIYRVSIFSDACFSGWKRSCVYSINSDGIQPRKTKQTEQGAAAQRESVGKAD